MTKKIVLMMLGACAMLAAPADADVFNMSGGLTSLEFVTVGDAGNAGELSGAGAGGYGPDVIVGGVAYRYEIGEFEVTAGQYTEFLSAVASNDPYGMYTENMDVDLNPARLGCDIKRTGSAGSYSYTIATDRADRPVNHVNWGDAARFANWLTNGQPTGVLTGNATLDAALTEDGSYVLDGATSDADLLAVVRRPDAQYVIPSEDEWYKAAYYDGDASLYYDYPTSTSSVPSHDVIAPDPGNNANFKDAAGNWAIGAPYYRTEVGEFENSASPYGTFDQGGNVWEWNEVILFSGRGMRGAGYDNISGGLKAACRYNFVPTFELCAVGFRIAEVPEPATLALLAIGAFGLLRRRRHRT